MGRALWGPHLENCTYQSFLIAPEILDSFKIFCSFYFTISICPFRWFLPQYSEFLLSPCGCWAEINHVLDCCYLSNKVKGKGKLIMSCYCSSSFVDVLNLTICILIISQIVGQMSADQRKVLLFFWTSVKYLPVEGFSGLASPLFIHKASESYNRLPSSHTCFYQLCFAPYPSMAVMEDRLRIITQEHVGSSFGTW